MAQRQGPPGRPVVRYGADADDAPDGVFGLAAETGVGGASVHRTGPPPAGQRPPSGGAPASPSHGSPLRAPASPVWGTPPGAASSTAAALPQPGKGSAGPSFGLASELGGQDGSVLRLPITERSASSLGGSPARAATAAPAGPYPLAPSPTSRADYDLSLASAQASAQEQAGLHQGLPGSPKGGLKQGSPLGMPAAVGGRPAPPAAAPGYGLGAELSVDAMQPAAGSKAPVGAAPTRFGLAAEMPQADSRQAPLAPSPQYGLAAEVAPSNLHGPSSPLHQNKPGGGLSLPPQLHVPLAVQRSGLSSAGNSPLSAARYPAEGPFAPAGAGSPPLGRPYTPPSQPTLSPLASPKPGDAGPWNASPPAYGLGHEVAASGVGPRPAGAAPAAAVPAVEPPVHLTKNGKELTVVNRGALRAALAKKNGQKESDALRAWHGFAKRQVERHTPAPDNMHRRTVSKSTGYRLRIQQVVDLPVKHAHERTFEFQLGVSLYDESLGAFYGNTCYSMHNPCNQKAFSEAGVVDLDFAFDVYFHSTVSDPRCMAVVEVIVLERNLAGVIKGEYSLGWAMLKLYQLDTTSAATAAPGMKMQDGAAQQPEGAPVVMAAPMVAGTPRYLLFRSIYGEDLPPPKVVERCHILYQAEVYRPMDCYRHLLPEDFLVTYNDVLPGLRRFDQNGQFTAARKTVISLLASPMLAPSCRVGLVELKMGIPDALHKLLSVVQLNNKRQDGKPESPPAVPEPRSYVLRAGVHNGRCFVGAQQMLYGFQQHCAKGWQVLHLHGPPPCFEVNGDSTTVLVLELLVVPQKETSKGSALQQAVSVGWGAASLFTSVSADGSQVLIAEGTVCLDFLSTPKVHSSLQAQLDWQSRMPDAAGKIAPPAIEFKLKDADKHGLGKVIPTHELDSKAATDQHSHPASPAKVISPRIQDGSGTYGSLVHAPSSGLVPVDHQQSSYFQPLQGAQGKQDGLAAAMMSADALKSGVLQPTHLADLADNMQKQLNLLARTVDELRQERKSLRSSLSAMPSNAVQATDASPRAQGGGMLSPQDLQHFHSIAPTSSTYDHQRYAGAPAPQSPGKEGHPSRAVMARLHEAGAYRSLPPDVQRVLSQQQLAPRPSSVPIHMDIEARDSRTVSDILVQLMAYKHQTATNTLLNNPLVHFTFQFYHFPPTVTEACHLSPVGEDDPDLQLLLPAASTGRGVGTLLKYVVDGTQRPLSSGQTAVQVAKDQHLHFCQFLSHKSLSIDIWDSTSQLQVGTATVELKQLLRQGRDYSEALLEVPVVRQQAAACTGAAAPAARPLWDDIGLGLEHGRPSSEQRGTLLLRLINIGREPSDVNPQQSPFNAVHTRAKVARIKVRAVPYTPSSPLARALTGRPNDAFASVLLATQSGMPGTPFTPYSPRGSPFGPDTPRTPLSPGLSTNPFAMLAAPSDEAEEVSLEDIYSFENRKLSRQRQLQQVREQQNGARPASAGQPKLTDADHRHSLQKQLLADVVAERARQKRSTVRQQLLRGLLVRQLLQPGYGEALVFEQEVCNPFNHEVVLELRISRPEVLAPVARLQEYKALLVAGVRVHSHATQAVGARGEDQLLTKDGKIFLAANEKINLPFKLQSFDPPAGYAAATGATSPHTAAGPHDGLSGQAGALQGHVIGVEVCVADSQQPVLLLEICVAPRPLVIDRTFRLVHPEKELLKHALSLAELPKLPLALTGAAAAGTLAVACSDRDVVVGVSSSDQGNGRAEVYIRCKGGAAPEMRQLLLLLYSTTAMAQPVEVWQVFVQSLKRVGMAAIIGQTSSTSVIMRGSNTTRRVACYSSHRDELQVKPSSFVLVAGTLSEVQLQFCPLTTGRVDVRVNVIDTETRELVNALLVAADAQIPLVTRSFEVEMPAGSLANKRINYTNPYQQHRAFTLRSNQPWLVSFMPPRLDLPPSATRPIGVILDGRNARPGRVDVLVFVNDEDDKSEECFKIRVKIEQPLFPAQ